MHFPLKRILRKAGIVVARSHNPGVRYLDRPPCSQFESALYRLFPDLHGLRFIQIGANNGQRADPLCPFLVPQAWTGLMVEPIGAHFAALRKLHGSTPGVRLLQAAVDVTPGHRPVYFIQPEAKDVPDWAQGLGSFSRERVLLAAESLGLSAASVCVEQVQTVSWDMVWQMSGPGRCDLLVTDTEGYDVTLLRAAGLAIHRPRLVHFEHACVAAEERLAFYRELLDLGYELLTEGPDTTAWLPA